MKGRRSFHSNAACRFPAAMFRLCSTCLFYFATRESGTPAYSTHVQSVYGKIIKRTNEPSCPICDPSRQRNDFYSPTITLTYPSVFDGLSSSTTRSMTETVGNASTLGNASFDAWPSPWQYRSKNAGLELRANLYPSEGHVRGLSTCCANIISSVYFIILSSR